jgi:hypothetical protein
MRDSGLLLFVLLFPYSSHSQTCAYVMRVAVNAPGVTSMGHEVREGHMKKQAVRHIHVKRKRKMWNRKWYLKRNIS